MTFIRKIYTSVQDDGIIAELIKYNPESFYLQIAIMYSTLWLKNKKELYKMFSKAYRD